MGTVYQAVETGNSVVVKCQTYLLPCTKALKKPTKSEALQRADVYSNSSKAQCSSHVVPSMVAKLTTTKKSPGGPFI